MATRKKTNVGAIANMVATQTAKAAALVAKAEQTAAERVAAEIVQKMHDAAEIERAAGQKAEGLRAEGINLGIDALRAAGMDSGEIDDTIGDALDRAQEAGDLTESTVKSYKAGLKFALARHVPWTTNMASLPGKFAALDNAGKKIPAPLLKQGAETVKRLLEADKPIPAALQPHYAKQIADYKQGLLEAGTRDAKQSKAHVASKDTILKHLAAALLDARTLGMVQAADILTAILSIDPLFTEPKADDTAPF